jgi:hypothetical protein
MIVVVGIDERRTATHQQRRAAASAITENRGCARSLFGAKKHHPVLGEAIDARRNGSNLKPESRPLG